MIVTWLIPGTLEGQLRSARLSFPIRNILVQILYVIDLLLADPVACYLEDARLEGFVVVGACAGRNNRTAYPARAAQVRAGSPNPGYQP